MTGNDRNPEYDEYTFDDAEPYSPDVNEQAGDPDSSGATAAPRGDFRAGGASPTVQGDQLGTVIGPSTLFSGTLSSEGPVTIVGTLEGEIVAAGDVVIAPEATVRARVQAISLRIAGQFRGSIACTQRFEVLESGRVHAEILAPAIVVHDGATINGRFRMRNGDEIGDAADRGEEIETETGSTPGSGLEGSE